MMHQDAAISTSADMGGPGATQSSYSALAILAHEIRGRLQSLTTSTESVRQRVLDGSREVSREWLLQKAETQAAVIERLRQTLDTVLAAYRASMDELRPVRKTTNLCEVVRAALRLESETLSGARCDCVLDAPSAIYGLWDRSQLELAIANLLNNAAKYGAGRPVEVSVFARERMAHVCVRDHGIGIRPEDLPRLFCRFARLDAGAARGIGLGLWFAKCVAVAHGGDVNACSAPSGGTSFTMTLPLTSA